MVRYTKLCNATPNAASEEFHLGKKYKFNTTNSNIEELKKRVAKDIGDNMDPKYIQLITNDGTVIHKHDKLKRKRSKKIYLDLVTFDTNV